MTKKIVAILSLILLVAGLGCLAISDQITPADINGKAVTYVTEAGTASPGQFSGYKNLAKARVLGQAVQDAYQTKIFALKQLAEKNQADYETVAKVAVANVQVAQVREEQLFGEKGYLSMGMSLLGIGGLGGILGLMRRKPGDLSPEEAATKDRQFTEVVKGVQDFMDLHKTVEPSVVKQLKIALDRQQSTDTKETVAVVKAA